MHRFRFTCLKILYSVFIVFKYIQDLVIPSMTHLETLVNVVLIVHWPLAGKLHRERAADPAEQMTKMLHPSVILPSFKHIFVRLIREANYSVPLLEYTSLTQVS